MMNKEQQYAHARGRLLDLIRASESVEQRLKSDPEYKRSCWPEGKALRSMVKGAVTGVCAMAPGAFLLAVPDVAESLQDAIGAHGYNLIFLFSMVSLVYAIFALFFTATLFFHESVADIDAWNERIKKRNINNYLVTPAELSDILCSMTPEFKDEIYAHLRITQTDKTEVPAKFMLRLLEKPAETSVWNYDYA